VSGFPREPLAAIAVTHCGRDIYLDLELAQKRKGTNLKDRGNRKDRDIGYALAAHSCEGVNDVEACTIAVFDVITAFAVPNPGVTSQKRRFFRVRPSSESPRSSYHSAYFGSAAIFEANPFSRRRCKTIA